MQHEALLGQQVKTARGLVVGIGLRLHEAEGPAVDLEGRPHRRGWRFFAREAGLRRGRALVERTDEAPRLLDRIRHGPLRTVSAPLLDLLCTLLTFLGAARTQVFENLTRRRYNTFGRLQPAPERPHNHGGRRHCTLAEPRAQGLRRPPVKERREVAVASSG